MECLTYMNAILLARLEKNFFFIPCLNIQTLRLTSSSLAKIFLVRFGIERTRPKTLQLANEDG